MTLGSNQPFYEATCNPSNDAYNCFGNPSESMPGRFQGLRYRGNGGATRGWNDGKGREATLLAPTRLVYLPMAHLVL